MIPDLVERYHQALPMRIRTWLHQRGISDEMIVTAKLGWKGGALTIPIMDPHGRFVFFKFRQDPEHPRTLLSPSTGRSLAPMRRSTAGSASMLLTIASSSVRELSPTFS